jgi:hypothetical protein
LIICHGTKAFKRADAGIRVHEQDDLYSVQEQTRKNRDKKMFFIVRVSNRTFLDGENYRDM